MTANSAAALRLLLKKKAFSAIQISASGRLECGFPYVKAAIENMHKFIPLLHTACFENQMLGPCYWP